MRDINESLKKHVVYALPAMEQSRVTKNRIYKTTEEGDLLLDVYYPADMQDGEQRPAVIFVHGMRRDEPIRPFKDSGQYVGWGQLTAATGLIAVTFNHRSINEHLSLADVAGDIDGLVEYVREHAGELHIDKEKLAIWSCSAGVPLGTWAALRDAPQFVKCLVVYYGPPDLRFVKADWELTEDEVREFSVTTLLEEHNGKLPPMFIARAGIDHPLINASIDSFVKEASARNATIDFMTHPEGHHAFDVLDDVPRSHEIIKRTLKFMETYLN